MRVGRGRGRFVAAVGGIGDAAVVDAGEGAGEGLFDQGEVAEGEIALGELAVHEAFVDHGVDGGFDAAGGGLVNGADNGFAGIADHDDGGFAVLGLGAGVAEFGIGNLRGIAEFFLAFFGGVVEIFDQRGAVVLANELVDDRGQAIFAGEFDAVLDVADDDQEAHGGGEFVVAVGAAGGLVLDEVEGLGELADIVIVSADAAEQAVGADGVAGGFGEDADGEGMMEGAGGFL